MQLRRMWAAAGIALLAAAWGPAITAASPMAPGIGVDPAGGTPLTTIKITGQGFCRPGPTCGPVSITIAYVQVDSSHLSWTSGSTFVGFVSVPGSARPGDNAVVAQQTVNGNQVTARTTFSVSTNVPGPTYYTTPPSLQPPGGFPASTAGGSTVTTTPPATTRGSSPGTSTPTGATHKGSPTTRAPTTTTTAGNAVAANVAGRHPGNSGAWPWIILAVALAAAILGGAWFALRRRLRRGENPAS